MAWYNEFFYPRAMRGFSAKITLNGCEYIRSDIAERLLDERKRAGGKISKLRAENARLSKQLRATEGERV